MKIHNYVIAVQLISAIALISPPVAADDNVVIERQGVWFGGYARGRSEKINIELRIIRDVGLLKIEFRRWEPVGSANCQYAFNSEKKDNIAPILNGSFGTPQNCPQDFSFDFTRKSPDGAVIRMNGASFLPAAELNAGLRPFLESDRRANINGLDILGVATGMSLTEVERVLSDLNFTLMSDWTGVSTGRGDFWRQETRYYVRQKDKEDKWGDTFTVQYSPMVSGDSTDPRASMLSRRWTIPEEQRLSELTLLKALNDKYGPALPVGEDRAWDRLGANLTEYDERRARCASGSIQQMPFSINFRESSYSSKADVYCGPTAGISIRTAPNTGIAGSLSIFIVDPDEVWDNFWRSWSAGEYETMRTIFESVSGATGAAPKL